MGIVDYIRIAERPAVLLAPKLIHTLLDETLAEMVRQFSDGIPEFAESQIRPKPVHEFRTKVLKHEVLGNALCGQELHDCCCHLFDPDTIDVYRPVCFDHDVLAGVFSRDREMALEGVRELQRRRTLDADLRPRPIGPLVDMHEFECEFVTLRSANEERHKLDPRCRGVVQFNGIPVINVAGPGVPALDLFGHNADGTRNGSSARLTHV